MKIEKPGSYKQGNGGKAEVVDVRNGWAVGYDSDNEGQVWDADDGRLHPKTDRSWDLIAEWKELRVVTGWVNVYMGNINIPSIHGLISNIYATLEEAKKDGSSAIGYVGTFYVNFIEGEGV